MSDYQAYNTCDIFNFLRYEMNIFLSNTNIFHIKIVNPKTKKYLNPIQKSIQSNQYWSITVLSKGKDFGIGACLFPMN